jgi:hypothetical protein
MTVTTTRAMQEARIELLQQMPIFGGIRTEILQTLLVSGRVGIYQPILLLPTHAAPLWNPLRS